MMLQEKTWNFLKCYEIYKLNVTHLYSFVCSKLMKRQNVGLKILQTQRRRVWFWQRKTRRMDHFWLLMNLLGAAVLKER